MVRGFVKRIADFINALAIVGLLLAYLAPFINPHHFWPTSFFGLTFTFWWILNLFLVVFWVLLRKRRWIYNLLFLLAGYQFGARNIQYNPTNVEAYDIKIAAFNANAQQVNYGNNTSNQISDYLTKHKFDVAVLVEWLNKKGKINYESFPHQQFVRLESGKNQYDYGIKIVSKHKIINWERIKYDHSTNNLAAYFDIDINGTIIRYVATHLQSTGIVPTDYQKLVQVELDDHYKNYALGFVKKLKKRVLLRTKQAKTINAVLENSPYPIIILGDFNDTPQSYTYEQLRENRKDAFIEQGNGWGTTYLKPFPFLRIDYILYDNELECTSYSRTTEIKSDHAMVEATFKTPN